MLNRTTDKIYSTDETGTESDRNEDFWGGKKPDKEKFKLISAFIASETLDEVLIEVKKWKSCLDFIHRDVVPLSEKVERRIDKLLNSPRTVLGGT